MKNFICYSLITISPALITKAYSQEEILNLATKQTVLNEKIIDKSTNKELSKTGETISPSNAQLIHDNESLKKQIQNHLNTVNSNYTCPGEKPKKTKTVIKTKETGGWKVMVLASGSSTPFNSEYDYNRSTSSSSAVNTTYGKMINAESFTEVKDILKTDTPGMSVEERLNYAKV